MLEFDHIDPVTKVEAIANCIKDAWSWDRLQTELDKCQLLCWPCHSAKSRTHVAVAHGGGKQGKGRCQCALCKAKKAEYMKTWHNTRANGETVLTQF